MPQTNGERKYSRKDAEDYVRKLGCWGYANPTDKVKRRDPVEYRELLFKLIKANTETRYDAISVWEVEAAVRELKALWKGE